MPRLGGTMDLTDDLRGEMAFANTLGRNIGGGIANWQKYKTLDREKKLQETRNALFVKGLSKMDETEGGYNDFLRYMTTLDDESQKLLAEDERVQKMQMDQMKSRTEAEGSGSTIDRMKEITNRDPSSGQLIPLPGFEQEFEALGIEQKKKGMAEFGYPDQRVQSDPVTGEGISQEQYEANRIENPIGEQVPDLNEARDQKYTEDMGMKNDLGIEMGGSMSDVQQEQAVKTKGRIEDASRDNAKLMKTLGGVAEDFVSQNQIGETKFNTPYDGTETDAVRGNRAKGLRADGTKKSNGWLGKWDLGEGNYATEYSRAAKVNGRIIEYPLIVPTLTKAEQTKLKEAIRTSGEIPESIENKANAWAVKRDNEGLSPFASEGESPKDYGIKEVMEDKPKPSKPRAVADPSDVNPEQSYTPFGSNYKAPAASKAGQPAAVADPNALPVGSQAFKASMAKLSTEDKKMTPEAAKIFFDYAAKQLPNGTDEQIRALARKLAKEREWIL